MIKNKLKKLLYQALSVSGIYRVGQFLHRQQALILTYHGVLQKGSDIYSNRNCVDAAMFNRQMAYLARHYHVVPLPDLVQRLRTGQKLPLYSVAITFDDGFRNNFTVAWPILKKHRLPATIFLTTSFIGSTAHGLWTEQVDRFVHGTSLENIQFPINGRDKVFPLRSRLDREIASDQIRAHLKSLPPKQRENAIAALMQQSGSRAAQDIHAASGKAIDVQEALAEADERYAFLTWDQAWTMAKEHITFGSHTHTHSIMSTLSDAEAHFELNESARLIEQELGSGCDLFSYPNGTARDFSARDQRLLQKLSYIAAFSQIDGFNDVKTDMMALRRINIVRDEDFNFFLAKISGTWSLLKRLR
jgi:peptidoglycan/xylan/chitin deacetylase (PgdA/CDA1 family)